MALKKKKSFTSLELDQKLFSGIATTGAKKWTKNKFTLNMTTYTLLLGLLEPPWLSPPAM